MYCKALMIALSTIALAAAVQVPQNATDGVYKVEIINGQEVHIALSAKYARRNIRGRRSELDTRGTEQSGLKTNGGWVTCYGDQLNSADTDAANVALDNQCKAGVKTVKGDGKTHIYSISGTAVAYFCALNSSYDANCDAIQRGQYDEYVTQKCGKYGAGEVQFEGANVNMLGKYVYGYAQKDAKFCDYGLDS